MSYFRKHWPSDLVLEVEEVVQSRVSFNLTFTYQILICIHCDMKFFKYYNARQSNSGVKTVRVYKAPVPHKVTRPNIDDTDSEDDSDVCDTAVIPTNTGMDEWKTYLNGLEDIPEGMGIVRWWGVSYLFYFLCVYH